MSRRDDWLPPPPPGAPRGADAAVTTSDTADGTAAWDDPSAVELRPPDAPDPADRVAPADLPGPADLTEPVQPDEPDEADEADVGSTDRAETTELPGADGTGSHPEPPSDRDGHPVRAAIEGLARATTPRERFAALRELTDAEVGYDDLDALLDAVPDGWQRRTVVRHLVRAGVLHDVDASSVVRRFARDGDRARVAGLLVRSGLAHVATVTDHLDAATAGRLRRRQR